MRELSFF